MRLRPLVPLLALLALAGCSTAGPAPDGAPAAGAITAAVLARDVGTPQRITIPALHVDAPITAVGLQPSGQLEVPDVHQVGWYRGSPDPGVIGPSLLAGHVNFNGTPGAFSHLADLKPGDAVTITGSRGVAMFQVSTTTTQPKPQVDWPTVLANVADPEIVLVTCGGAVSDHEYADNVIVHAALTPPR